MTGQEFADYRLRVAEFMKREGIDTFSSGVVNCPDCGADFDDSGACEICGETRELFSEPFVSSAECECCGDPCQGNRGHVTAFRVADREVLGFNVCEDCVYYVEYGRLDDRRMREMSL